MKDKLWIIYLIHNSATIYYYVFALFFHSTSVNLTSEVKCRPCISTSWLQFVFVRYKTVNHNQGTMCLHKEPSVVISNQKSIKGFTANLMCRSNCKDGGKQHNFRSVFQFGKDLAVTLTNWLVSVVFFGWQSEKKHRSHTLQPHMIYQQKPTECSKFQSILWVNKHASWRQ